MVMHMLKCCSASGSMQLQSRDVVHIISTEVLLSAGACCRR